VLEVSASNTEQKEFFREQREYRNVGLSRQGEASGAVWLISAYSEEQSTAFRPFETKSETFTIPLPENAKNILLEARVVSQHGLPVEFDRPEEGKVVLKKSLVFR
jgi:hypothetical protein